MAIFGLFSQYYCVFLMSSDRKEYSKGGNIPKRKAKKFKMT